MFIFTFIMLTLSITTSLLVTCFVLQYFVKNEQAIKEWWRNMCAKISDATNEWSKR